MKTKKSFSVYIIAGEPSGDFIGSKLIDSLKFKNPIIKISGVGGSLMKKAGLSSLFDIKTISIVGIFEVIPSLFKILKLIKLTIEDIKLKQPDALITIDSPGFNLKVAKVVKKLLGKKIKLIHYVAPSVWAYKPRRAKKFAKTYDYLFCLLPFEPPYFEKEGLKTFFVGHPVVESKLVSYFLPFYSSTSSQVTQITTNKCELGRNKYILLLPGSRRKEVIRLLPIFLKASNLIKMQYPDLNVIVATIPEVEDLVKHLSLSYKVTIVNNEVIKYKSFLESKVALAASGTVTLELALAGVKTVVAYKLNIFTSILYSLLVKVKFVSLVNIMSNKEIFPEILGPKCTSKKLSNVALELIKNDLDRKTIYNVLHKLGYNSFIPSKRAADLVINILEQKI